jgi:hypothetical protein
LSLEAIIRARESAKNGKTNKVLGTPDGDFVTLKPSPEGVGDGSFDDVLLSGIEDISSMETLDVNSRTYRRPLDLNLDELGLEFPFSTREILKYRIRKKTNLRELLFNLADAFLVTKSLYKPYFSLELLYNSYFRILLFFVIFIFF